MTGKRKVFGIGFQKTGTTSLHVILDKLGYHIASYHEFRHLAKQEGLTMDDIRAHALKIAPEYDAGKDTPWPLLYKEMDAAFPGSKFIHVTRDPEAWIRSAVTDFEKFDNWIHHAIYGTHHPTGNEDIWLERYNRHNAEVADYFKDRPDDCLFLRLEDGITYEKVCDFLGEPRVGSGAPKANTRQTKRFMKVWWRWTNRD